MMTKYIKLTISEHTMKYIWSKCNFDKSSLVTRCGVVGKACDQ